MATFKYLFLAVVFACSEAAPQLPKTPQVPEPPRFSHAELLTMLPKTTHTVGYVNVKAAKASALTGQHQQFFARVFADMVDTRLGNDNCLAQLGLTADEAWVVRYQHIATGRTYATIFARPALTRLPCVPEGVRFTAFRGGVKIDLPTADMATAPKGALHPAFKNALEVGTKKKHTAWIVHRRGQMSRQSPALATADINAATLLGAYREFPPASQRKETKERMSTQLGVMKLAAPQALKAVAAKARVVEALGSVGFVIELTKADIDAIVATLD